MQKINTGPIWSDLLRFGPIWPHLLRFAGIIWSDLVGCGGVDLDWVAGWKGTDGTNATYETGAGDSAAGAFF